MHESSFAQYWAYSVAILVVDTFDAIVRLVSPSRRPPSDYTASDIDNLTDEAILQLRQTMPKLNPTPKIDSSGPVKYTDLCGNNIVRITEGTVVKTAQDFEEDIDDPAEANALSVVFHHTTIPVPRVRRVVKGKYSNVIAMDFVPGQQLSQVWPTLSFLARLRIALTLRRYIRQLRAICHPRSSVPGPLATSGARMCESPVFGQVQSHRGPFGSRQELAAFFDDRRRMVLQSKRSGLASTMGPYDDSRPLVLTHQDINMRNLIVGDDGRLWFIDWAWAGFYPRWFEFVAMKLQAENEEVVTGRKEPLWDALIPFICDPCFREERWLDGISRALCWV